MALGCGTYRVLVHTRATLASAVLELPWTALEYGRALDETSTAKVTVSGPTGDCCDTFAGIGTWSHQLAIYRATGGGAHARVWSGPVVSREADADGLTLEARDLSAWLDRRFIHDDHLHDGVDLTAIFADYFADAMAPDPVPAFTLEVTPSGAFPDGEREVLGSQHRIAGEELRELARTGVDWTVIDRVMIAGGEEVPTPPIATLLDSHFADVPKVADDGLERANRWVVAGAGGGAEGDEIVGEFATAYGATGLLEGLASEPAILDAATALEAARSRAERTAGEQAFIEGGRLTADAPVTFATLVPGARLRVALGATCIPVRRVLRLAGVKVSASVEGETVDVSLQPLGSTLGA